MNIVLFGFKSCGKSTVGRLVAVKLHKTFIDIDSVIEDLYHNPLLGRPRQLSAKDIYRNHGEEFFRALERDAIRKLRLVKQGVVATGGGAVLDYYNHQELKKNGFLIYLKADKEVLRKRTVDQKPLPAFLDIADPNGSFEAMYEERVSIYERVADAIVDTRDLTLDAITDAVCAFASMS